MTTSRCGVKNGLTKCVEHLYCRIHRCHQLIAARFPSFSRELERKYIAKHEMRPLRSKFRVIIEFLLAISDSPFAETIVGAPRWR